MADAIMTSIDRAFADADSQPARAIAGFRPNVSLAQVHNGLARGAGVYQAQHSYTPMTTQELQAQAHALQQRLDAAEDRLNTARNQRITERMNRLVEQCRVTNGEYLKLLARAFKQEDPDAFMDELELRPAAVFGGSGVGASVQILSENPLEKVFAEKDAGKRHAIMAADWDAMISDAMARDNRGDKFRGRTPHSTARGGLPVAANTYSATLVTAFLADGATTILQHKCAPLDAFTKDFSADRYKPLASAQLKKVTAGSTTQTDATNFESGNSTVAPVEVAMHQYTQAFHVSNSDLNSGLRMQDLTEINAAKFGEKLIQVATAPITEANFTATPYVAAPAAFGWGDMAQLWATLKKATRKNAILDGEYIAMLNNTPTFFQNSGVGTRAALQFGWDKICLNTDWSGAGTGVRGLACDPQAIGAVTGLPLTPTSAGNSVPGGSLSEATFLLPGLNITVALYVWFALGTRTLWASYDIMLGAKELDTTAGQIIKAS